GEWAGDEGVRTLLGDGNLVISPSKAAPGTVGRAIDRVSGRRGVDARVVVRTVDELAAVIESNPLPHAAANGSLLHVMFLEEPLTSVEREAIEAADFGSDEVRLARREIYVWYRNGMSGSDTAARLGKLVRTLATDRNWNTVEKLLAMARSM